MYIEEEAPPQFPQVFWERDLGIKDNREKGQNCLRKLGAFGTAELKSEWLCEI